MITTQNLTYSVNGKVLIEDVSTVFNANKINLIIGANGAGKSTLINLLCNQINPTKGSILYEGLKTQVSSELSKVRAVLSQHIDMAFPLTVREIVLMGRYPHFSHRPTEKDKKIVNEAMDLFKVNAFSDRNYQTLSGGEKQRVHFARVVSQIWPDENKQTKCLLLDEPLTYLDVYYQFDFMNKIKAIMQLQPMVVIGVLHDLNLAYQYADQVLLLENGKVFQSGTPEKVFTKETILQVFDLEPSFFKDNNGKRHLSF